MTFIRLLFQKGHTLESVRQFVRGESAYLILMQRGNERSQGKRFGVSMGKQHYPRPVRNANRSKNTTEESRGERDRVWVNSIASTRGWVREARIERWERSELSLKRPDVSSYPPISPHRPSLIAKLKAISTDSELEFDAIYRASRDSFEPRLRAIYGRVVRFSSSLRSFCNVFRPKEEPRKNAGII